MSLTKSMIRTLIAVINGHTTLEELQKNLNASKSWIVRVVNKLESNGFLKKTKKGRKVNVEISGTSFAINFREMYLSKPYRKYESLLPGKNLDILLCIVYSPKSVKVIGEMLHVQPRSIRQRLRNLGNYGLIYRQKGSYVLSRANPDIQQFIGSLRKFSKENGRVLWKFDNEMLFKVRNQEDIKGELTGFNRYKDYGVMVQTIDYNCYVGKGKLGIEQIFIHSLFEIEDPRTLGLALTFYAKNGLCKTIKLKKMMLLAEKFDVLDKLEELIRTYEIFKAKPAEKMIGNKMLPSIDLNEIRRQFEMYGVKDV